MMVPTTNEVVYILYTITPLMLVHVSGDGHDSVNRHDFEHPPDVEGITTVLIPNFLYYTVVDNIMHRSFVKSRVY